MEKVSSSNSQGVHVPKLRFPGFEGEWKASRLSDISGYQTGKGNVPKRRFVSTENMLHNFAGIEPYMDESIVSGIPFVSGDVLIANIRPYLKKAWQADFDGCCSTDVLVLRSTDIDSNFLYYNIAREGFISYVMSGVKGSKMPRGDKAQILEYKVGVPTQIEQQKIASLLSLVDNRIAKQRQLVEALKSYKRGALSKLFPKKGETTPEYRFAGFTEPWKQQKWCETVDMSKEMVDPRNGIYNSLPHVAPGNIESFTGRLFDNVKTVEQEELISGKFHFHAGDIIYCKINPQLGKYYFAKFEGLTSADAYVLNAKNGVIQEFLFAILQTKDFFDYSVSVSKRSGMPKINREELNAYLFLAPSELEQEQIGTFLMYLDHLISSQRSKIDEYERLKAGLLQQLFI